MAKLAVIKTGGKQYKVSEGDKLKIEKNAGDKDAVLNLDKVLLIADGEDVKIGTPYLEGVSISAKILRQARTRKKIVFKYASKTRRRTKKTHRQYFTEIEITKI